MHKDALIEMDNSDLASEKYKMAMFSEAASVLRQFGNGQIMVGIISCMQ